MGKKINIVKIEIITKLPIDRDYVKLKRSAQQKKLSK